MPQLHEEVALLRDDLAQARTRAEGAERELREARRQAQDDAGIIAGLNVRLEEAAKRQLELEGIAATKAGEAAVYRDAWHGLEAAAGAATREPYAPAAIRALRTALSEGRVRVSTWGASQAKEGSTS